MISRRSFLLSTAATAAAARPLRALLIDGVNNHDWQAGTEGIRSILAERGGMAVEVSTAPRDLSGWAPTFTGFDVVINNFNGGHTDKGLHWPEPVQRALETYLRGGGGLVAYHAANNAFLHWPAYHDMVGLLWRPKAFGPGLRVDDRGKTVVVPAGTGLDPGHGPRHDFDVEVVDRKHPVTTGLPPRWRHPSEQLTHGQHGPAKGVHILTCARSEVSGFREPMDWVLRYGKGRVYVTMLGHTWRNEANPNLTCPEFRKLFANGVEWAATGRVARI